MANRYTYPVRSATKETTILGGLVTIGGSGAVTACTIPGASAAKTATGEWTITLGDGYPSLQSAHLTVVCANNVDGNMSWKTGGIDVLTAKTLVAVNKAGTTATDLASGAAFYVTLFLKNTTAT